MDADTLCVDLQEGLQSCQMDWMRRLPDAQVLDPRYWPDLLGRELPYPPLHSVLGYAALARESMRRLSRSGAYPGYADDRDPEGQAVCLKTALQLLQPA